MAESKDQRGNRVRRILDAKRQPPEYQRLDYEPKEGGRSLLHDEFGLPKVAPASNKGDIPIMKEIPNEPVAIKASQPKAQVSNGIPKRGTPSILAQQSFVDDGFIPPKNNFVSVGQVDNAWATKEVTGLPDTANKDSKMVDNNWPENPSEEDGDQVAQQVEKLQGMNPLADLENDKVSATRKHFEHRLQHIITEVIEKLQVVDTLDELANIKANVLGKNGILASILRQFSKIPPADRAVIGEAINNIIDQLKLEFEAKEYELTSDTEDEEDSQVQWNDEEEPEPEEEPGADIPQATAKISTALEEGQFAILIEDKLFSTVDDAQEARKVLTRLILGNNVPVENIQLIKRVPIDFGVILDD